MPEPASTSAAPAERAFGALSVLARWLVLGAVVGALAGAASAAFLALLDRATALREADERLVYTLPLAGLLLGWCQERFGQSVRRGNNLVIDRIADGGPQLPKRMAPFVLIGTVLTHLVGGSAGREGTAVQMAASLADWVSHGLGLSAPARRELLIAGVAGGFGSVFGTPVAGVVFAAEFTRVGRLDRSALAPATVAALVGDLTTRACGIGHSVYPTVAALELTPLLAGKWLLFAAAVAATAALFIELTHGIKRVGERWLPRLPLRLAVGGVLLVVGWRLVGTSDYLGLGVPLILRALHDPALPAYVFALKLLFTAVTIGSGYVGGEVTPLFFVGVTLGAVLARWLGIPIELGAAVGLAAVFGAASNTPLALSVMAVELFGVAVLPHVLLVLVFATLLTGHRTIYSAQRLTSSKWGRRLATPTSFEQLRQ